MTMTFEMMGRLKDHAEVGDKAFRDATVETEIRRGLPIQIREMREARGWSQAQLGDLIGKPQNNISRIENTREKYLSIKTLVEIASVFDVGLLVKFVPFSEVIRWTDNHSLETVIPKDFDAEIKEDDEAEADLRERAMAERAVPNLSRIDDHLKGLLGGGQQSSAQDSGLSRRPPRAASRRDHGTSSSPASSSALLFSIGANQSPQTTGRQ